MSKITASYIAKTIEKFAPPDFAMDRDNVGLLVGDKNKEINKILVCCDVDEYVAKEAVQCGADMIVSHHPTMFYPINRLTEDNPEQRAIRILVKNDICHYAAHTNLDVVWGGLNDYLAKILELKNVEVIEKVCERDGKIHGYGRLARLNAPCTLEQMLKKCKQKLNLDGARYVGDLADVISTVAINTGGGASVMGQCFEMGADLLITGDIKYNPARDAYERGMDLIDIMHYDTEKIVMDFFVEFFAERIPGLKVIKSKSNIRIYKVYC